PHVVARDRHVGGTYRTAPGLATRAAVQERSTTDEARVLDSRPVGLPSSPDAPPPASRVRPRRGPALAGARGRDRSAAQASAERRHLAARPRRARRAAPRDGLLGTRIRQLPRRAARSPG